MRYKILIAFMIITYYIVSIKNEGVFLMKTKTKQVIEVSVVYIAIYLIVIFIPSLVSLVHNVPMKMILMLVSYILMVGVVLIVLKLKKEPMLKTLGFKKQNIRRNSNFNFPSN